MADTNASEAARALIATRWGPTKVVNAADVVIERADELPEAKRAELLGALIVREDVTGHG